MNGVGGFQDDLELCKICLEVRFYSVYPELLLHTYVHEFSFFNFKQ